MISLFVFCSSKEALFISFVRPKEMNQRKGQPQIFFGSNIFSAAHAIQLALRLPADRSNSIAYLTPSLRSLQNVPLFPKKIWRHNSPYGDLYLPSEFNIIFSLIWDCAKL
jgi:hypothetical protein